MIADHSSAHRPLWAIAASAMVLIGACVALGLLIAPWIGLANLAFIFLLPVVVMAGRDGVRVGLATAAAATLAFNFFFVPPTWTLHVASLDNVLTLVMFALTALAVSQFSARLKAQAERAERLAADSSKLAQLSVDMSKLRDEEELAALLMRCLADWSGAHVQLIAGDTLENCSLRLSPMDHSAAQWALSHGEAAGRGAAVMAGADALFLPMDVGRDKRWLAQFWRGGMQAPVANDDLSLIIQAVARGGDALNRARVAQAQAEIEARAQQDAMREALLASISHDLRTPLTGIRAGLDALEPDTAGVLAATRAEATRLERMVTNLLDLARLKANALPHASEVIDLTDVIDAALEALPNAIADHPAHVFIAPDLPLVRSDAVLLHHMLINLIENACKYSPDGAAIALTARYEDGDVLLTVADRGAGFPAQMGRDLFSLFQRGTNADRMPGSGLGLAVVDGFARALGLSVTASNISEPEKTGAIFTIRFPASLALRDKAMP
ncbi:DUF4118 domain-containing protein [Aquisediminimonas sediminicola]|uniref:DUF4118 domain-containing protein n=1 Tax=Alteraquisediminimonas sediminicola TaxID=2676787 RepID=UPI001C8E81AA|nr:DUF4118 domain-containing protein [Aquisediminimonas sediminicola]